MKEKMLLVFLVRALLVTIAIGVNSAFADEKPADRLSRTAGNTATVFLDFFGNGLTSWAVVQLPTGGNIRWSIMKNENPTPPAPGAASIISVPWGFTTDTVSNFGDYGGTGVTNLSIARNTGGLKTFMTLPLTLNQGVAPPIYTQWGLSSDIAGGQGDYDGDGKMDPTVVRQTGAMGATLQWYILRSSDGVFQSFRFGVPSTGFGSFIVLPGADYTGDGADDPALILIATNTSALIWAVGTTSGAAVSYTQWGNFQSDFIVPAGDYDGDDKADFMVFRGSGPGAGIWYLLTNSGTITYTQFGIPGFDPANADTPLRSGDYDGDGKTDIAVYRSSNGTFYVMKSGGGFLTQFWNPPGGNVVPLASFGTF